MREQRLPAIFVLGECKDNHRFAERIFNIIKKRIGIRIKKKGKHNAKLNRSKVVKKVRDIESELSKSSFEILISVIDYEEGVNREYIDLFIEKDDRERLGSISGKIHIFKKIVGKKNPLLSISVILDPKYEDVVLDESELKIATKIAEVIIEDVKRFLSIGNNP